MEKTALLIKNLKKIYKNNVEALKGIDLEVKKGDFFALLGPNGAGKSTTINIIINLVNKTSGEVKVFGYDTDKDLNKAKMLIGVVPQEFNFNIFEKVFDIVVNQAGYYGIGRKTASKRAEKYLKLLDLWPKRNAASQTLSGGLKRRLMIARALVHEPQLLILDEPTAGVDIELRRSMWEFMKKINAEGKTIILTTHYLEEAENLCRNIAIIDKGIIIANTSMRNLLTKLDKETYIFDLKNSLKNAPKLHGYHLNLVDDNTLEAEIEKKDDINAVFHFFFRHNIKVLSIRRKSTRLEELFISLVNKK